MEWQNASINFGQGLDTKTDSKLVVPGKLTLLQNGIFTQANQISKRNGYAALPLGISGGGTVTNPQGLKVYNKEMVCAGTAAGASTNGQRLFSFSSSFNAWIDKGKYIPNKVTKQTIGTNGDTQFSSSAQNGNYVCTIWNESLSGSFGTVFITVLDTVTNTYLIPRTQISLQTTRSSVVYTCPLGGSPNFLIFYANNSNTLSYRVISISGSSVVIGSETALASSGRTWFFYVITLPGIGAAISYFTQLSTNGTITTFNSSGTISNTAVVTDATSGLRKLFLTFDGTNIWLFLLVGSGTLSYYIFAASNLATVLAQTTISSSVDFPSLVTSQGNSTNQTAYYSFQNSFRSVSVTNLGVVGTPVVQIANAMVYSNPTTIGSLLVMAVICPSSVQPSGFLIDLSDFQVIAKFLDEQTALLFNLFIQPVGPFNLFSSGTKLLLNALYFSSAAQITEGAVSSATVTFDFSHPDLYQSALFGDSAVWNGGILTQYDGQPAVELGFNVFPEIVVLIPQTSSGSMADGTYEYFVVYRWFDNAGNLHQSAPSIGASTTISGGGGNGSVQVWYTNLGLTQKQGTRAPVEVAIFRTSANGTVAKLVSSVANNPQSANYQSEFLDIRNDSSIANNETLYTTGGVIENITPPPATLLTVKSNRLWIVDSENPNTVWYSKTFSPGIGISFSDLLIEQVDETGGEITALAAMDEKIVYFKQEFPLFSSGDGANDTGSGSTLTVPQLLPAEVGCSTPKSIILTSRGLFVKGNKGFYLFDRGLNSNYIGAPIEAFNSQVVTSASYIDGKNQIRFLTNSGSSFVYDYFFNQWSTFSNHQGNASDIWNGVYVYARTDGSIVQESSNLFLDNGTPYRLRAQTAWIKGSAAQGFARVRRWLALGDFKNGVNPGHGLQISAAYNYISSFLSPIQFLFSTVINTSGPFQYRERASIQKCEAFQLLIEEIVTGAQGEFIDLSDLGMEIGVKKGAFKLPATQSVG